MGKSLFLGTIIGALIVFSWLLISWFAFPWHCSSMQSFTGEQQVVSTILEHTAGDGLYLSPNFCESQRDEEAFKSNGPAIFTVVKHQGFDLFSLAPYLISLATQLVGAFLLALFLILVASLTYWRKVMSVSLIALFVGVVGSIPYWNFWHFPIALIGIEIVDFFISWTLAGFVMAAIVKRD